MSLPLPPQDHSKVLDGYLGGCAISRPLENVIPALQVWVESPAAWINSNDRRHRMAQAKLTKAWRDAAAESVPPGWDPFPKPVRIVASIWKTRAGAYDAGNLYPTAKACVDGFRDANLLIEDSNDYVIGPDMRHGGKGPAGILFYFYSDLLDFARSIEQFRVECNHIDPDMSSRITNREKPDDQPPPQHPRSP